MTEYKVGDRGVTRDGREAVCGQDGGGSDYPLSWVCDGWWWWTTRDGRYWLNGIDHGSDIVRRIDAPDPETAPTEQPPTISTTLRTPARYESDEFVIGGVHLMATTSGGKVSLWIGDKELTEDETSAVMRTIKAVMDQARRAKEVVG